MKEIRTVNQVEWPNETPLENFQFTAIDDDGEFIFKFKLLSGRWHCWVTLPNGTVREAGVYPNVINWTGAGDYGLVFLTSLKEITKDTLYLTEMDIIKWR